MKPLYNGPGTMVLALLVVLAAGLAAVPEAQATFIKRKQITIDRSKVGNSGAPPTLSNYPFLYSVMDPQLGL